MGIYYTISEKFLVTVSIHVGETSDAEFVTAYRALFADPKFVLDYPMLVDLTRAKSVSRSTNALHSISILEAQLYAKASSAHRVAVIAPADVSYGLTRIYKALADQSPGTRRIFRSDREAVDWLGVSMSPLEEAREKANSKS